MLDDIYDDTKQHMDGSIEALKREYRSLRTGKVEPSVLDNITIDYYGTDTKLSQVATILSSDATTINISPWEKNLLKDIEQAISAGNIGVTPNNNGESIQLFFPPMTVEQRHISAKEAKAMTDGAKVSIRNIRKHSNDMIKKLLKDKDITEDESKKAHDEIQKITDSYSHKVDEMLKTKETEILKV
ncbi:MAG: ribosome recycling factor [Campylobacteraceae bacterium 4484_166]|nr:MAG: ribosome recycling factor [Campylobacteraceae bacterium 4484_166]